MRERIVAGSPALSDHQAQVLHGDLNLGNVLFADHTVSPAPLDFEDSRHNFHGVAMDLAMALERFVLVRTSDDGRALSLGHRLLAGYAEHAAPWRWGAPGLAGILQSLAVRALLLLAGNRAAGRPVAESEWDKFLYLYAETERRAELLRALESS